MRGYGDAGLERSRFRAGATLVRDGAVRRAVLAAGLAASLTFVVTLATAATYVVTGQWVVSGSMSVGTMVAMVALLARLYGPLTTLPNVRVDLVTGMVGFARVREVLDFPPLVADAPDARGVPEDARPPSVTFSNVTFTYPRRDELVVSSLAGQADEAEPTVADTVLRGVDLTVAPGTTVGVVGLSGAGKSTLGRLLTRSWDVTSGQVLVGGIDVRRLRLAELHDTVGVVSQETFLFNDTVRANLSPALPDAGTEELVAACRAAQVWHVVENLPAGLETVVGDRGVRLSGGERQRLAIARLLLKRPPVVVLDEATSSLDNETDLAVRRALRPFLRTRTCLVIAHRLATVMDADLIVVVWDGRVVEAGGHEELVAAGGHYARLYRAQLDRIIANR